MNGSKVKVKLNHQGVSNVMKSDFMLDALMEAGKDFGKYDTHFIGGDRLHVRVNTKETEHADRNEG